MQSALNEVGALYVSAVIHDGWWELMDIDKREITDFNTDIPYIPYHDFPRGNHAFVIMGYTKFGFIIQNSWGTSWGNCGFGILSYKDWLKHGMDVWVAVMGVPIDVESTPHTYSNLALSNLKNEATEGTKTIRKALRYEYKHDNLRPISEEEAYHHTLVLNSYGRAKHTIIYTCSTEKSIDIVCYDKVKEWLDKSKRNKRVALYALGGFNNEKESLSKIRILAPYFLENGIYPIFLTWQSSYVRAIENSIEDFFQNMLKSSGIEADDILEDREALNRAIENHGRKISTRAIWAEIKEKSLQANIEEIEEFSSHKRGALHILTDSFQKLKQEYGYRFEIHALAHSAGAQLIATEWLMELSYRGMTLNSLQLVTPTLSLQDANNYIITAHEQALFQKENIHVYMLDREMEYADNVSKYGKSLLTLISRSLEKIHKTPLLGIEDAWDIYNTKEEDGLFNRQQLGEIKIWHEFASIGEKRCLQHILTKKESNLKSSANNDFVKLSHQNLDRSISILESMLEKLDEVLISIRGINRFVVVDIKRYNYLRECELEKALRDAQDDIKNGRSRVLSSGEHFKEIDDALRD
jgi:hypothetical protein